MVSFVLYGKDKVLRETCVKVIKKFMSTSEDYYKIYEYDRYSKRERDEIENIVGVKIFLLNLDTPGVDVCSIARSLREGDDMHSQIILLSGQEKVENIEKLNNILYLDYIKTEGEVISKILKSIMDAYRIVTRHEAYGFKSFGEIYRISYDKICYIEKNSYDDSVTIYTLDDSYVDYITIIGIEGMLKSDARFYKTHRSCIVNLYNIEYFDTGRNVIAFKNGMTIDLVSKYRKAELVSLMRSMKKEKVSDLSLGKKIT